MRKRISVIEEWAETWHVEAWCDSLSRFAYPAVHGLSNLPGTLARPVPGLSLHYTSCPPVPHPRQDSCPHLLPCVNLELTRILLRPSHELRKA